MTNGKIFHQRSTQMIHDMTHDIRLRMPPEVHADLKLKAKHMGVPLSTLALLLVKMSLDQRVEVSLTRKRAS